MSPPVHASIATSSSTALIFGCGYLGRRVANRWIAANRPVYALTRSRSSELAASGISPILGDVLDPQSLRGLPRVNTVLYAVGFDRASGRSMRDIYVQGLANVLEHVPTPERFLYVSSTSVYGQTEGEWVTEDSVTEPHEGSGLVVREAETLLRERLPEAIVLRFAGMYGPNRLLREAALKRGEPVPADPDGWLNLIHIDDGSAAVLHAEKCANVGDVLNVADDTPVTRRDFYECLAEVIGAPVPTFAPAASAAKESNRRISNRKLRAKGWAPQHSSYQHGLNAC
jgi:nucleoside-diphosphate-sugar epimerase